MKKPNDEEVNNIFDDISLDRTIKKAKRNTLLRSIIVSAIMFILISVCVVKANSFWINKIGDETAAKLIKEDAIMKAPNTIVRTETVDTGFLKGTVKREVFKVVEDKIIPWETQEAHFGLKGFETMTSSSYSTIINDTNKINIPSGEKSMGFYVPQFTYKSYSDDLSKLKEYPNDKYIELGISFDKNYTMNEVKNMLPDEVNPTWYWVNDYSNEADERDYPEGDKFMYGIYEPSSEVGKSMSSSKINSEADFLNRLKKINKDDYDLLKLQQKDGMIIGVVVTGTKEALLKLENQSYVKATSIGAVVDKY